MDRIYPTLYKYAWWKKSGFGKRDLSGGPAPCVLLKPAGNFAGCLVYRGDVGLEFGTRPDPMTASELEKKPQHSYLSQGQDKLGTYQQKPPNSLDIFGIKKGHNSACICFLTQNHLGEAFFHCPLAMINCHFSQNCVQSV